MHAKKVIQDKCRWDVNAIVCKCSPSTCVGGEFILLITKDVKLSKKTLITKTGFVIEQMIEQNDKELMESESVDDKNRKAKMVPLSVCFKARKF